MCIAFVQVHMSRSQPLVVLGLQPPCEQAPQARRALPERDRFGTVRVAELFLDERDAFAGDPLVRGRQKIRPWCGQHRLQALAEALALLEAQPDSRILLPELRIDLRQQRLVVLPTQPDDVLEGIEARLPGYESRLQI